MTAVTKNLDIEQGATFVLSFVWYTGTITVPGAPVNLTGYTARMQIRVKQGDPVLWEGAVGDGIVIDGPAGKVTITLTDTDTDAFTVSTAVYDLELIAPGGSPVVRLLQGSVKISPNITQVTGAVLMTAEEPSRFLIRR